MSVIDEITREVETDPAAVGLILHGSRAAGTDREGSDFDLMRVVTDEVYPACAALREKRTGADGTGGRHLLLVARAAAAPRRSALIGG